MEEQRQHSLKAAIISSYAYIRGHNNYGSILQYYALQQYLRKFGVEAFWIRYMFPTKSMYIEFIKKTARYLLHGFRIKNSWNHLKTQIAFRHFMHEKCRVSTKKIHTHTRTETTSTRRRHLHYRFRSSVGGKSGTQFPDIHSTGEEENRLCG